MKTINAIWRATGLLILFMLLHIVLAAQSVEISKESVTTWFQRNGVYVAAGAAVLVLILIFANRRSATKKTTTIIKDDTGRVKRVTTTEVQE